MEELAHIDEEPQIQGPALIPIGVHAKQPTVPLYRMTVIGSHESMHLRLVSPQVSRAHVVILNCDGGVFLHDLSSRDGVQVNGRPATEAELQEGDIVRVGNFSFRLAMNDGPHHHRVRRKPRPVHLEREDGEPLPLNQRVLVIGQRRGCGLRLKDAMVATVHAVLLNANGRHYLRDLGSHNGTMVNGRRIRHVKLRPGDVIQIARHTFRYARVDAPRPVVAEPAGMSGFTGALADSSLFAAAGPAAEPVAEGRFFAEEPSISPAQPAEPPAMLREPILLELPAEVVEPELVEEASAPVSPEVADSEPADEPAASLPVMLHVVEEAAPVAEPTPEAECIVEEQVPEAVVDPAPTPEEVPYIDPFDAAAVVGWTDSPPFAIDSTLMAGTGVDADLWPAIADPPPEPEMMAMEPCREFVPPAEEPEVVELPELAGVEFAADPAPAEAPAAPEPMLLIGTTMMDLAGPDDADGTDGTWAATSMAMPAPELVVAEPQADEDCSNVLELTEWPELTAVQIMPAPEPPDAPADEPVDASPAEWQPVSMEPADLADEADEPRWPAAMDLPSPEVVSAGVGAAWPMDDRRDSMEVPELGAFQVDLQPFEVESVPVVEAAAVEPLVVQPSGCSSFADPFEEHLQAKACTTSNLEVESVPAAEAAPTEPLVASVPLEVRDIPAAEAAPTGNPVEERPEVSQIIALAFTGGKLGAKPAVRPAALAPPASPAAPQRLWMFVAISLAVVLVVIGAAGLWLFLRGGL